MWLPPPSVRSSVRCKAIFAPFARQQSILRLQRYTYLLKTNYTAPLYVRKAFEIKFMSYVYFLEFYLLWNMRKTSKAEVI